MQQEVTAKRGELDALQNKLVFSLAVPDCILCRIMDFLYRAKTIIMCRDQKMPTFYRITVISSWKNVCLKKGL